MKQLVNKKVNYVLVGIDGNAFSVLGTFRRNAQEQGWTKSEIDTVMNEAMSGDYDHLLATIIMHVEEPKTEDEYS